MPVLGSCVGPRGVSELDDIADRGLGCQGSDVSVSRAIRKSAHVVSVCRRSDLGLSVGQVDALYVRSANGRYRLASDEQAQVFIKEPHAALKDPAVI